MSDTHTQRRERERAGEEKSTVQSIISSPPRTQGFFVPGPIWGAGENPLDGGTSMCDCVPVSLFAAQCLTDVGKLQSLGSSRDPLSVT